MRGQTGLRGEFRVVRMVSLCGAFEFTAWVFRPLME